MKILSYLLSISLLGLFHDVLAAKAVFAHFMLDNTGTFGVSEWKSEMSLAITAKIDAFALNIAAGSPLNGPQIANAFTAANFWGFKLFFSFDYAGGGPWDKADVISLLRTYTSNSAYFRHDGSKPLVSTFEGPEKAADWPDIKAQTGCFFIPDWSSLGAGPATALENGVADGLFNWAAWSWGGAPVDTYTDASYTTDLGKKPYMMAVSPWFYTNLPGYKKNWMWPDHTMSLWADRWNEVLYMQPDYVEIISWNDFGESHYIGNQMDSPPFSTGKATFDYVKGMKHDAWRWPLAIWADQYKKGQATITDESLTVEYRESLLLPMSRKFSWADNGVVLHHVQDCNDGHTTVNTASQLQMEFTPGDILGHYYIGYSAVLASHADVVITVGGSRLIGTWLQVPAGGAGVYHGKIQTDKTGAVTGELVRDGNTIVSFSGEAIGGCTEDGYANFNPWVGGDFSSASVSATTQDISKLNCTSGTGAGDFASICSTTCKYGYCPTGACVCTSMGLLREAPKITGDKGYAKDDPNYDGLCSWAYNYGFKYPSVCSTTKKVLPIPAVSPFLPDACTGGKANRDDIVGLDALCEWSCRYGWCPINLCACTSSGNLIPLESATKMAENAAVYLPTTANTDLTAMCNFACQYGNCVCEENEDDDSEPPCDFSLEFGSLSDLEAVSSQYSAYCNELYTLEILSNDMAAALADYQNVNNGYDEMFGYYVKYMENLIDPSLGAFMAKDGAGYFDCNGKACPKSVAEVQRSSDVTWVLRDSEGFWSALLNDYGIEEDWIEFSTGTITTPCPPKTPTGKICSVPTTHKWKGYPGKAKSVTIPNPKDLFTSAGPSLQSLPITIEATWTDLMLGQWEGSALDAVQVVSTPVALAQQAVAMMDHAKSVGETEKEEEQKALILTILSVILAVVPFIGEFGAASAGMIQIGRAIALAGLAGNAALDTYSLATHDGDPVMSIFGLLFGVGGAVALEREAASYARMGQMRRDIDPKEILRLGDSVHEQAKSIQSIVKSCNI